MFKHNITLAQSRLYSFAWRFLCEDTTAASCKTVLVLSLLQISAGHTAASLDAFRVPRIEFARSFFLQAREDEKRELRKVGRDTKKGKFVCVITSSSLIEQVHDTSVLGDW